VMIGYSNNALATALMVAALIPAAYGVWQYNPVSNLRANRAALCLGIALFMMTFSTALR